MKKNIFLNLIMAISFFLLLTGCNNAASTPTQITTPDTSSNTNNTFPTTEEPSNDSKEDIFDHFGEGITTEDVINDLGNPVEIVNDDDLLYNEIDLCSMPGTLTVEITDSNVVFVLWEFDAEGRTADDCKTEMQTIYNHYVDKFGDAEIREYSTRSNIYIWHRNENNGPAGSPQYVLDFNDVDSKIRVYLNFNA